MFVLPFLWNNLELEVAESRKTSADGGTDFRFESTKVVMFRNMKHERYLLFIKSLGAYS